MSAIHIAPPELIASPHGGDPAVSAAIDFAGTPLRLWIRLPGAAPECRTESFIAPLLLPAMAQRLPIECAGAVSPLYLRQLETIQDIFATWLPSLRRVPVRAPVGPAASADSGSLPGPEAAAFFTGGVDSFHTVLSHADEIRRLVFVPHFEAPPGSPELGAEIEARLRAAAAELGMELLVAETNLRSAEVLRVLEPGRYSPKLWNFELAHGAALAAIAHALPRAVGRVYVAASATYDDLFPWGSHPLLDPLWSTETRQIVHDGCAHTRVAKAARIASSGVALRALRVCAVQHRAEYNCGRCEKCLRTMVELEIVGALPRAKTFPNRLNLLHVALLPNDERSRDYLEENLRAAQATGRHAALARALRIALRPRGLPRRALGLGLKARRVARSILPLLGS
ncbi:MAG TPA: hypothetical protein VFS33_10655 [Gemmatimonadales bacterium]|nr:hypothetical protein [Gemmatimonadales bacterium]